MASFFLCKVTKLVRPTNKLGLVTINVYVRNVSKTIPCSVPDWVCYLVQWLSEYHPKSDLTFGFICWCPWFQSVRFCFWRLAYHSNSTISEHVHNCCAYVPVPHFAFRMLKNHLVTCSCPTMLFTVCHHRHRYVVQRRRTVVRGRTSTHAKVNKCQTKYQQRMMSTAVVEYCTTIEQSYFCHWLAMLVDCSVMTVRRCSLSCDDDD